MDTNTKVNIIIEKLSILDEKKKQLAKLTEEVDKLKQVKKEAARTIKK